MTSQNVSKQVGDTIAICVRVPRSDYEKLGELARIEKRTISNLVNVILTKHINQGA